MIPEYFAIVGAAIASIGTLYYLYDTVVGKTKPNRITWLLWGVFPMIIFFAQRAQGVEGLSWVTLVTGLGPLVVFGASFLNKNAYWKSRPMDYYLLVAAVVGLAMWAVTDNANLAIMFALLADFLAGVPTFIKAYKHPETESWVAFGIAAVGFFIAMLAIQSYTFENSAFVIYLLLANALLAALSSRKPAKDALLIEP